MDLFDLAQSFIEQTVRDSRASALGREFQKALEVLGFRYFACCSHVNPLRPPRGAVVMHNYPDAWAREFCERKLYEIDPVLMHAERTLLPFFWDSPDFQAAVTEPQREILEQAANHGLAHGYTIPIHLPWTLGSPRASCSVVPDSAQIDQRSYFALQLMAMHLYCAASREGESVSDTVLHGTLSPRERQCLELVAQGKSDWAIGQILNLSEHVVHQVIEKAKRRLGVATRVQAIVCALQGREISMGDAIRADAERDTPPPPNLTRRIRGRGGKDRTN